MNRIQGMLSRAINWGSNKPAANASAAAPPSAPPQASPELTTAWQELFGTGGYRVTVQGGGTAGSAQDALSLLHRGQTLSVSLPDSTVAWPVETADKLSEFVYGESGQTQNLPAATQQQFSLLAQLKRRGVKFYAKSDSNKALGVKAAPLWQLGKGSLWASVKGGPREKIEQLDQFASSLGINPAPVPAAPPVAVAPDPIPAAVVDGASSAPAAGDLPVAQDAAAVAQAPVEAEVAAPAPLAVDLPAPQAAPVAAEVTAAAVAPAPLAVDVPAAAPQAAAPVAADVVAQPVAVPAAAPQDFATPPVAVPPAAPQIFATPPVAVPPAAPQVFATPPVAVPPAAPQVIAAPQSAPAPSAPPPVFAGPAPVPAPPVAIAQVAVAAAPAAANPVVLLATPDSATLRVVGVGELQSSSPAAAVPTANDAGIIAGPVFGAAPQTTPPAAAQPAVAPAPVAPADSDLTAPINVFEDAIIAPSALPVVDQSAKAKKVKDVDADRKVVNKEMLFILPPGQKRLTRMPVAPSKMLTETLVKNGVSFIYMNVMATKKSRLDNFLREHPMVSKLLESSGTSMPAQMGVSRLSGQSREKVREFLVALPGDFNGDTCTFTPNLEMASSLAISEVPVAYIRLSGSSTAALDMLNNFVRTKTLAESNS